MLLFPVVSRVSCRYTVTFVRQKKVVLCREECLEGTGNDPVGLEGGEDDVGNPQDEQKYRRQVLQHCNNNQKNYFMMRVVSRILK